MKNTTITNTTRNENIPQFIAVGEYSILDRMTRKLFDCHYSDHVRAACDMYKFYSYPNRKANNQISLINHLPYIRVAEYSVKHEMPYIKPNPFDNYTNKQYYKGNINLSPNQIYSNGRAKIIVKLFTSNDINIALNKSRIINGNAKERKIEWERRKKEIQVIENKNNDFFIIQDKTNNNKDDSLHSVLFDGIDNSDFNALSERCKLIRNIVHLHTCNNAGLERILSETEKATDNYLLEKDKQEIKSCLDLDNVPPERIKEILKLIKGDKGCLK